ncbi:tyrosine-type recombinase/integrase [Paenibacillus sp. L3-i20]|uniref:tyrosine-type recombinase/integrase n=1 Tax=Paenibacillus sp. L3-i20 TaxID=2905833 RepID=UPI001EE114BE|nr:tyrosine-type recombinase/integrase [Paenibacillus sp. L3-i20]GKU80192.1 site-specific integrase [Paenibacillus sp. L3-i20]
MAKKKDDSRTKEKIFFNEEVKNGKPWWFQVMVNGKRKTRRGFKTRTEAKKAREALSTDMNRGVHFDPAKGTYGEYFVEWLSAHKVEETTTKLYQSFYDCHIKDKELGNILLSKLSAFDIKKFISHLKKDGKREGEGLADASVKRMYATVDASLNDAEALGLIIKNPTSNLKKSEKPKVEKKEREIWSNDSVKYVLSNSKGSTRYWIAFFLAVMTGMRQGEILGLKWKDIDFDKNIIKIRRSLRKDTAKEKSTKNVSSYRIISISPLTAAFLREHQDIIGIERKNLGSNYQDNDYVVCSRLGTPARASKVLATWYTLCDKFKPEHEPNITFHDLRHQSASIMLNEREDIRVVSQLLGHSTVATTLNTYSHLLPTGQETAVLSLDRTVGFVVEVEKEEGECLHEIQL